MDVACNAYHQEGEDEEEEDSEDVVEIDDGVSPKEVGHNIYILCHQLAQHNKELAAMLKPNLADPESKMNQALQYYASHTAQIEVCTSFTHFNNCCYLRYKTHICVI